MDFALSLIKQHQKKLKYLISGGTAFLTYLLFFHFFLFSLTLPTFWAAASAYLCAFSVSYILQKTWTFEDTRTHNPRQIILYFTISACNLLLNSSFSHVLIDWYYVHPTIASIGINALIAVWSYFAYGFFVFKSSAQQRPSRILIITQAVDLTNPALGFFHEWITEFSKHFSQVSVLCLEKGQYTLPTNVSVYSLGKEKGASKISQFFLFLKCILFLRNEYDVVFCHMSPIFVIIGAPWWKLLGKKSGFWYTHRHVDMKLRVATRLTDFVCTASQEGFMLKTNKLHILGHGIDVSQFTLVGNTPRSYSKTFTLLSVGRITPVKNIETIIEAVYLLTQKGLPTELFLIGEPVFPSDIDYKATLQKKSAEYGIGDRIHFIGAVAHRDLPTWYRKVDATVNASPTGGMDKVVLESLASGTPAFVSNEAFRAVYSEEALNFIFQYNTPPSLVQLIISYTQSTEKEKKAQTLVNYVTTKFSLKTCIEGISELLKKS